MLANNNPKNLDTNKQKTTDLPHILFDVCNPPINVLAYVVGRDNQTMVIDKTLEELAFQHVLTIAVKSQFGNLQAGIFDVNPKNAVELSNQIENLPEIYLDDALDKITNNSNTMKNLVNAFLKKCPANISDANAYLYLSLAKSLLKNTFLKRRFELQSMKEPNEVIFYIKGITIEKNVNAKTSKLEITKDEEQKENNFKNFTKEIRRYIYNRNIGEHEFNPLFEALAFQHVLVGGINEWKKSFNNSHCSSYQRAFFEGVDSLLLNSHEDSIEKIKPVNEQLKKLVIAYFKVHPITYRSTEPACAPLANLISYSIILAEGFQADFADAIPENTYFKCYYKMPSPYIIEYLSCIEIKVDNFNASNKGVVSFGIPILLELSAAIKAGQSKEHQQPTKPAIYYEINKPLNNNATLNQQIHKSVPKPKIESKTQTNPIVFQSELISAVTAVFGELKFGWGLFQTNNYRAITLLKNLHNIQSKHIASMDHDNYADEIEYANREMKQLVIEYFKSCPDIYGLKDVKDATPDQKYYLLLAEKIAKNDTLMQEFNISKNNKAIGVIKHMQNLEIPDEVMQPHPFAL
ncbi:MAG: hypothetical protein Tsb005_21320 [Gammaproteobacteria bacterium]